MRKRWAFDFESSASASSPLWASIENNAPARRTQGTPSRLCKSTVRGNFLKRAATSFSAASHTGEGGKPRPCVHSEEGVAILALPRPIPCSRREIHSEHRKKIQIGPVVSMGSSVLAGLQRTRALHCSPTFRGADCEKSRHRHFQIRCCNTDKYDSSQVDKAKMRNHIPDSCMS
jgi:hypothetical protein